MSLQIKKILVPVDFTETSESATLKAVTIAKMLKAELFLLHVVEFNGYHFSIIPETEAISPAIWEIEKNMDKRMALIQEKIQKEFGIITQVYISTGNIVNEIMDFSKRKEIDLIIMGTHGASGYKELFIGSNAQQVVTLSNIPVLTMQNHTHKLEFKNILVPIDNSLHSREKVNIATVIAKSFSSMVHLLGLPDTMKGKEFDKFKIKLESVEKIIHSEKLSFKTTLINGDHIAQTALNYANKNKCDLIVINTGHESKITGIFLGTFAQQIVNHSKIPVLSVKHREGSYSDTSLIGYANPFLYNV